MSGRHAHVTLPSAPEERLQQALDSGRPVDEETALLLDVVGRVRAAAAGADPVPRPEFRAELRRMLVGDDCDLVGGLPVAELGGGPLATVLTLHTADRNGLVDVDDEPAGRHGRARRWAFKGAVGTFVAAAAAAAVVIVSGGALPGDPLLYRVKRGTETVNVALASGATKAHRQQDLVDRRVGELTALGSQRPGRIADPGVVDSTLDDLDANVRASARVLTLAAVQGADRGQLESIASWAEQKATALGALRPQADAGDEVVRLDLSITLLALVRVRAATLATQVGCVCLDRPRLDELGPLPCSQCSNPDSAPLPPVEPPAAASGGPAAATGAKPSAAPPDQGSSVVPGSTSVPLPSAQVSAPAPAPVAPAPSAGQSAPGLPLPLPLPLPTPTGGPLVPGVTDQDLPVVGSVDDVIGGVGRLFGGGN